MNAYNDLFTVSMFGELRISVNNLPIPRIPAKAQELFALLVLWNELPISRKRLAAILWPDSKQPNALGLLRACLLELRKALGPAAVRLPTEDRTTLRLDLNGASVDVFEFDRAVRQDSPEALQAALALYRHELLQGWKAEWVQPERERRALAYARLVQRTGAAATGTTPPTSTVVLASEPLSPPLAPSEVRSALTEIRKLLASNRTQLERVGAQLDRLEAQLNRTVPDAVTQNDASRAESLYTLGVSRHMEGDVEGSRACLEQALQIAQRLKEPTLRATILHQLGRLEVYRDKDAARRYFLQAYELRVEQQHKILGVIVSSLLGLGDVAATVEEAMGYYERALRTAEPHQDESGMAWSHFNLALSPLYRGVWESGMLRETLLHYKKALSGFITLRETTGLFAVLDGLARVCHQVGHTAGAERMLAIEAKLRVDYATQQVPNEDEDASNAFITARRQAKAAASKAGADLGWTAALKEAEQMILDLPEIVLRSA